MRAAVGWLTDASMSAAAGWLTDISKSPAVPPAVPPNPRPRGGRPRRAAANINREVREREPAFNRDNFPPLHAAPFRGFAVDISSDNGNSQKELADRVSLSSGWEVLLVNPFTSALPRSAPRVHSYHGFPEFDQLASAGPEEGSDGLVNRTKLRLVGGLCADTGYDCALINSPVTSELNASSIEAPIVDVGRILRNMDSRPSGICYLRLSVGYFDVAKVLLAWPWNDDWMQFWPDHLFLPEKMDSAEDEDVSAPWCMRVSR